MSIFSIIGGVLDNPITRSIGDLITAKERRKTAKDLAESKIKAAKINNEQELSLKTDEWDAIVARGMDKSLKDEYVTFIITSPLLMILVGSVFFAFTGNDSLLQGVSLALDKIKDMGIDMGMMMWMVVGASLGIRVFRR